MVVGFGKGWIAWQSARALNTPELVQNGPDCEIHVESIKNSCLRRECHAAVKYFSRNSAALCLFVTVEGYPHHSDHYPRSEKACPKDKKLLKFSLSTFSIYKWVNIFLRALFTSPHLSTKSAVTSSSVRMVVSFISSSVACLIYNHTHMVLGAGSAMSISGQTRPILVDTK